MSPSFKRQKSRGLGFIFLYFKETLFPWDKPGTCQHCKQSKVVIPEMIHHLSVLPCSPEPRSFEPCGSPAEVTVAEGRATRGAGRAPSQSTLAGSLLPGPGTDAGFLCRISKCSPPQSHSPDVTSALVKTSILQHFFKV